LAKTPRDDRHENPKRDRMKRKRPSRFLAISQMFLTSKNRNVLESRDIIRDTVEQESTDKGNDDSHDVMEGHEERVPNYQLMPSASTLPAHL
jgi:hypothetical protein